GWKGEVCGGGSVGECWGEGGGFGGEFFSLLLLCFSFSVCYGYGSWEWELMNGIVGGVTVSKGTFHLNESELGYFWHRCRSTACSYLEPKGCRSSCFSARGAAEA